MFFFCRFIRFGVIHHDYYYSITTITTLPRLLLLYHDYYYPTTTTSTLSRPDYSVTATTTTIYDITTRGYTGCQTEARFFYLRFARSVTM